MPRRTGLPSRRERRCAQASVPGMRTTRWAMVAVEVAVLTIERVAALEVRHRRNRRRVVACPYPYRDVGGGSPRNPTIRRNRRHHGERASFSRPSADLRETDFAFVRLTGGHSEILPAALAMKLRPTRDPCLSRIRYCPQGSAGASGESTEIRDVGQFIASARVRTPRGIVGI